VLDILDKNPLAEFTTEGGREVREARCIP